MGYGSETRLTHPTNLNLESRSEFDAVSQIAILMRPKGGS